MKADNKNPKRNDSGYLDLTAYEAIKKVDKDGSKHSKNERNKEVFEAIKLVKNMLRKFDLIVINRIKIKDKRTGKTYR